MDRQKYEEQTFVIVYKGLESGLGGKWLLGCAGGTYLSLPNKTIVLWL